jgi:hypothetical protein
MVGVGSFFPDELLFLLVERGAVRAEEADGSLPAVRAFLADLVVMPPLEDVSSCTCAVSRVLLDLLGSVILIGWMGAGGVALEIGAAMLKDGNIGCPKASLRATTRTFS